ncbi:acyltransferase [Ramlibacter sp. G-1-2-2]|uniref:Acyltransferase n=1 Tax=Ramlibacter agri TaxID=2728837 RepID=A0A848H2N3_9BURK|nr:acyltransferase family protein [Ramlibacter agri]NML43831.1 acyltransferase [Ramlibacter agri]
MVPAIGGTARAPAWRADIDGLRAVAILAVVGFHFFPGILPAGFAGVDVFFVISGYLITRILLAMQAGGGLSIGAFYAARVRRIFPALCLVLMAAMLAGLACMYAEERDRLASHVLAGAGFFSNLRLWGEAGYFDAAIESKPLAHLWSLGVEEQFYLAWPLVLSVLLRWRAVRSGTLLLLAASLVAGIIVVQRDPEMAFYVPLYRVWELLAGALLAVAEREGWTQALKPRAAHLSAAGFVLLALSALLLHPELAFPGAWALLPVAGATLVIAAGADAPLNRLLLSNRAMTWVGGISYPLYLWHWPVLAFARLLFNAEPGWPGMLLLVGASFLLAWLTWRFVERPVRSPGRSVQKAWGLALAMAFVAVMALHLANFPAVLQDSGRASLIPERPGFQLDHDPVLAEGCGLAEPSARGEVLRCLHDSRGPQRFALLGDSKAEALFDGLVRTSSPAGRWLFVGGTREHSSVVPVVSDLPQYRRNQVALRVALDAVARNPQVETVVIATATRSLYRLKREDTIKDLRANSNHAVARDGLRSVAAELLRAGKKVVLLVDNPTLPDPAQCLLPLRFGVLQGMVESFASPVPQHCQITVQRHRELSEPYLRMLQQVRKLAPDRVTVVDTLPFLCDMVHGTCRSQDKEGALYSYTDHISALAATRIGAFLNAQLASPSPAGRE